MTDLLREIGQTMSRNKLRTALTGIAVSWGIFMLIVLLGMSHGVLNAFNASQENSRSDLMSVRGGYTTKPHAGYKEGRTVKLRDSDGEPVVNADARLAAYSYSLVNSNAIVSTPDDYLTGYQGSYPSALREKGMSLWRGRFISDADLAQRRKVAVVPKSKARALFGPDSLSYVGRRVTISGLSFLVVGIYSHDWETAVFIPFTTARMLAGDAHEVTSLTVAIRDVTTEQAATEAEQSIRRTLAARHDFAPDDDGGVWIWNRFTQHLQTSRGLGLLDVAIWVIGLLTMLSGIVGVSNIMFVSVKERTHEIGIRRAIGAKPRAILLQVITESVCITALFGYLGVVTGVLATAGLGALLSDSPGVKDPGVDLAVAFEVTLVLVAAGALAGLFPALKAVKVKPVEALRDE